MKVKENHETDFNKVKTNVRKEKGQALDIERLKNRISDWVGEDTAHRMAFAILVETDGDTRNVTCDIEGDMLSLVEVSAVLASESDELKKLIHLMAGSVDLMDEQDKMTGN